MIEEREAHEQRFDEHLLLAALAKARLELADRLQHAQQVGGREAVASCGKRVAPLLGNLGCHAAKRDGELRAQHVGETREHAGEIHARLRELGHRRKHITRAMLGDDVEHRDELVFGNEAECVADAIGGDAAFAAHGQDLIGETQRVAHRSVRRAGDRRKRLRLGAHVFGVQHVRETIANLRRTDALEVEPLETAQHGRRHLRDLLGLGGGEHEHHARRRLFENLEQRVPCFTREHVRFVDDVHLVRRIARRGVHGAVAQVAGIVDAAIGCRVDLDDVEAGRPTPDAAARRAFAAGLAVERRIAAPLAVERHGEHARERRLAHTARPAEQVAVRDAASGDRALQRRGHVRLHGHVGKPLGAVRASESE